MRQLILLLLLATLVAGERIALVIDVSASVSLRDPANPTLTRHALRQYAKAQREGQLALYECATNGRRLSTWQNATVANFEKESRLLRFDWDHDEAFTNWEACLRIVADDGPTRVYFVTDGEPTMHCQHTGYPPSDDVAVSLNRAIIASTELQNSGVQVVLAVGVGPDVSVDSLRAISTEFRLLGDYLGLADVLAEFVVVAPVAKQPVASLVDAIEVTEKETKKDEPLATCLVHVWDDLDGNGVQEGPTGPEANLQGARVTLTDATAVTHMGVTDLFGNIAFPGVSPGIATVEVEIPPEFELSAPAENPFATLVPAGPAAHAVSPIGLQRVAFPAVPEANAGADHTISEIAAAVIAGGILLILLTVMTVSVCVHRTTAVSLDVLQVQRSKTE